MFKVITLGVVPNVPAVPVVQDLRCAVQGLRVRIHMRVSSGSKRSNRSSPHLCRPRVTGAEKIASRLLVKAIDKARLTDLDKDGIVDEGFGLRGLGSGMGCEVEHGLHGRRRDEGQSFPGRQERLIGIFEVGRIRGLGILTDDLLREFRLRRGDLDSFQIGL